MPGLVAPPRREAGAARLQPLRERADIVGLDEEHVERIAALAMEAAHRFFVIGDLRKLDPIEALAADRTASSVPV